MFCCHSENLALLQIVKKSQAGGGVAVKIEHAVYQSAKMFGRHFDEKDELYSHITRQSIDELKVRLMTGRLFQCADDCSQASFKEDVSTEEWLLIKALKPVSSINSFAPGWAFNVRYNLATQHSVIQNDPGLISML